MTDYQYLRILIFSTLLGCCALSVSAQTSCDVLIADRMVPLHIPMCEEEAAYCLAIPFADLSDYQLMEGGSPFSSTPMECTTDGNTLLMLDTGFHRLIITYLPDNCFDTLDIQVHCFSDQVAEENVFIGQTASYCIDTTDMMGNLLEFNNQCTQERFVDFTLDLRTGCVVFFGMDEGVDTACIELCTDLGDCKSLMLVVTAAPLPPFDLPEAENDIDSLPEGDRLLFDVTLNDSYDSATDTLRLVNPSNFGSLVAIGDGIFGYQSEEGVCGLDSFTYEICNPAGCDQATVILNVICNQLRVYTGFSPNGDDVNDQFLIEGLTLYPDNVLRVFNRWGGLVFEQQGYRNDWDGRWNGEVLPDGTYFYVLELNDEQNRVQSGYVLLYR